MDHKDLIIIALVIALIYLYYQNRKKTLFYSSSDPEQAQETSETIANLREENEDLISEKDSAIRQKNEAEAESLSLENKLKLKNQEVTKKETEITELKKEKNASEIALNKKITELKEKYSKQGQLLDNEQLEGKKLEEKITNLETKITELETERKTLLVEINKHDDLNAFQSWLNENEENKANLPDWDKIITEVKTKIADYHLSEKNWASGLLTRNTKYWQVFKTWVDNSN